jgi:hypothetical protein
MRQFTIVILLLLCVPLIAQDTSVFPNLRHSSRDANGNLHLRWEEYGEIAGIQYEVYHSLGGSWQSTAVTPLEDLTREALIPYEFGQRLRYRLRTEMEYMGENMAYLHAAYQDGDVFPMPTTHQALIGSDPVGDSLMVYSPHLDITESHVASTETKLYRSIGNVSGSFPTMLNLTTFNIYIAAIANYEAAADSTVYAMVYSFNIPGLLSTGLYKIGMGEDNMPVFNRLGNVQSQVSGGRLHLSCDWDDLTGDPGFGAWPNELSALMITDGTMQVSVDLVTMNPEFAVGDNGAVGVVEFKDLVYDVAENTLPTLTVLSHNPTTNTVQLLYNDAEQDFPLQATVSVSDGSGGFVDMDMIPIYNPDGSITFNESAGPNTTYSVSDNGIDFVSLGPVSNTDPVQVPMPALSLRLPNPISANQQSVDIQLSGLQKTALELSVYNIKGQKVLELPSLSPLEESAVYTWNRAQYPSLTNGVYFMRLTQAGKHSVKRFIISN